MSLILDRDLLRLAPRVFIDGEGVGTILVSGSDGNVSGTTFSSASVDFEALGIDEGHVASVADEALEVVARPSTSSLTVSRPRMTEEDPMIPPPSGSGLKFTVVTFERQIAAAQAWALGALGIDVHDPVQSLDETAVVNAQALADIIALRTICDVYASAAAAVGALEADALSQQAVLHRERLRRAVTSTSFLLDLNGDGVADATRRLSTIILERSS